MSTQPKLHKSLVGLANTFTTILCDMYAADVKGVTLEMTKNVFVHPYVDKDGSLIVRCNAEYFSAEFNYGKEPLFRFINMSIEDYMESVRGNFTEDDWDNNAHDIGTIAHRLKEINDLFQPLSKEERELEFTYAKLISQWFVILRWLEEIEFLGLDDDLLYVPSVTHEFAPTGERLTLDNNLIQLYLSPGGHIQFSTNSLPAKDYIAAALKEEDQAVAEYYINEALDTIADMDSELWDNLK
jgi:hypothetical protein